MMRFNLVLFGILIATAIALVTARYQTRLLRTDLEVQVQLNEKLTVAYNQLQLEQSTHAMHAKLERYAREKLNMAVPGIRQIQMIQLEEGE